MASSNPYWLRLTFTDPSWLSRRHVDGLSSLMTRILVMSETLSLAEIKAHLSEIVDRVEAHHERVTLTRNGRPAAVLISPEDLESLEDTLELLADPTARAEIEQGRREIAAGKGIRADDLRARYLNKA
jgi:prevent-host-death family protein